MSLFSTPAPIVITCNKRLAPYVAEETAALGFVAEEVFATGLRLNGTLNDCIRLNLSLRCASQVLYTLFSFRAEDADALYRELHRYPWEGILAAEGYFSVTSFV